MPCLTSSHCHISARAAPPLQLFQPKRVLRTLHDAFKAIAKSPTPASSTGTGIASMVAASVVAASLKIAWLAILLGRVLSVGPLQILFSFCARSIFATFLSTLVLTIVFLVVILVVNALWTLVLLVVTSLLVILILIVLLVVILFPSRGPLERTK